MDNSNYWKVETSSESVFGRVAHLNTVCWLELAYVLPNDLITALNCLNPSSIHGCESKSEMSVCVDVVFRVRMTAANFSATWKVSIGDHVAIIWEHGENNRIIDQIVQAADWAYFNIGSIRLPHRRDRDDALAPVKIHILGS
jgi:hypothetical protein